MLACPFCFLFFVNTISEIWGAPFDMSSPKVAAEIGGRLGEVVEVKRRKKLDAQNPFMRVKVAIPTSKPLRQVGFIGGLDGKSSYRFCLNISVFPCSATSVDSWDMT